MDQVLVFTVANPTFKYFLAHSAVLITKTLSVALATGLNRAYLNEEDAKATVFGAHDGKPRSTPTIDRLIRMHRNDLENIIPFLLTALLYIATKPDPDIALWHFRLFTGSRLLHSVVYFFALPTNARASCWFTGVGVTLSMAYRVFCNGAL
ncbi:hypothetical protein EGW08_016708 [Elysia chlorotica]|uniref:Microsomal glutathione S-transferase 1 n=1 Tax=Elysia chlorotica TaxID=188477 RepID=A0A433T223_ELYCH|nr:hypothetical protein EGW08_016708 [Elysia chlorotica]